MKNNAQIAASVRLATKNLILKNLPEDTRRRLLPDLIPVEFRHGQTVYRAGDKIDYLYFPNHSMVSVTAMTEEGNYAEVGVVGYEGLIGMEALMGGHSTLHEHIVQHADGALRIKAQVFRQELDCGGILLERFLNYTRLLLAQIRQTALCNSLHRVNERLARWLLLCRDRTKTDELQLTHEFLAQMLSINRPTVTVAVGELQKSGAIEGGRGRLKIIDHKRLEQFSCECYRAVKNEYDRAGDG